MKNKTILLIALCILLSLIPAVSGWGASWGSYQYRKNITIAGSTGAGTNYTVKIITHYGSGSDTGNEIYLSSHSQSDFDDIRFTDNDGETFLWFWREVYYTGDNATFWVNVGDDLGSNRDIVMYYGYGGATRIDNITNTFPESDNMSDITVFNAEWTKVSGAQSAVLDTTTYPPYSTIYLEDADVSAYIEYKRSVDLSGLTKTVFHGYLGGMDDDPDLYPIVSYRFYNGSTQLFNIGSTGGGKIGDPANWNRTRLYTTTGFSFGYWEYDNLNWFNATLNLSQHEVNRIVWYDDDEYTVTKSWASASDIDMIQIRGVKSTDTGDAWFGPWFFRKYVDDEPAVSSVSSEQQQSGSNDPPIVNMPDDIEYEEGEGAGIGTWDKYDSNPITGTLNGYAVSVWYNNSHFIMFYQKDYAGKRAIWRRVSANGKTGWVDEPSGVPVLQAGSAGNMDDMRVHVPYVVEHPSDSTYIYMFYGGWYNSDGKDRVFLARSADDGQTWLKWNGASWSAGGASPLISPTLAWEGTKAEPWGIIYYLGTWYVWYNNLDTGTNRKTGYATATSITGPYTKYASNPVFTAGRFCPEIIKYGSYFYMMLPHYTSGSDYTEIELYKDTAPTFLSGSRQFVKIAFQYGTSGAWDDVDIDTPFVLTGDGRKQTYLDSGMELWCYYGGYDGSLIRAGMCIEESISFALGEGATINWIVSDSDNLTGPYTIYKNGDDVYAGTWTDDVSINYDVSNLGVGVWTYVIQANDGINANCSDTVIVTVTAESSNQAPYANEPADFEYAYTDTGNEINWIITDPDNATGDYTVWRNGTKHTEGTWNTAVDLEIDVDGLAINMYNFTIEFNDGVNANVTDQVWVEVIDQNKPWSNHPVDITYEYGETGNFIPWTIYDNDDTAGTYYIEKNGVHHWWGVWNNGSTLVYAQANIDGLAVGTYNFTILFNDGNFDNQTDLVWVSVTPSSTSIDTTTMMEMLMSLMPLLMLVTVIGALMRSMGGGNGTDVNIYTNGRNGKR